jgi:hypothetical protein
MMTFEQFQATRTLCDDLREVAPDAYEDDSQGVPWGFIYDGDTIIQGCTDGMFLLLIHNEQWLQSDLTALERILHQWCIDEFGDEANSPHRRPRTAP